MFFKGSRYANTGTYSLTLPNGSTVTAAVLPAPLSGPLLGYYPRAAGQRLDLIANYYLSDATAFWRLCDANDAMVPEALAAHNLVGIPAAAS